MIYVKFQGDSTVGTEFTISNIEVVEPLPEGTYKLVSDANGDAYYTYNQAVAAGSTFSFDLNFAETETVMAVWVYGNGNTEIHAHGVFGEAPNKLTITVPAEKITQNWDNLVIYVKFQGDSTVGTEFTISNIEVK